MTDSLHDDLEDDKPSPWRKAAIIFAALIMVSLFVVYAVVGPVQHKIVGNLHSESLLANSLHFKDYSLFFEQNTSSILSQLFTENQEIKEVEMSVCLSGQVENKNYYLETIFYPTIIEQSMVHVSFASCPLNTLVMLHSHPFGDCLASDTDLKTLKNAQKRNEDVIMVIMCSTDRYALYH